MKNLCLTALLIIGCSTLHGKKIEKSHSKINVSKKITHNKKKPVRDVNANLFAAIKNKSTTLAQIQTLLDGGASISAQDSTDTFHKDASPLQQAASAGRADICIQLINAGANVNATAADQSTPLCTAAGAGSTAVCMMFLDKGAKLAAVDSLGFTPLVYLAENFSSSTCCKFLLAKGACVFPQANGEDLISSVILGSSSFSSLSGDIQLIVNILTGTRAFIASYSNVPSSFSIVQGASGRSTSQYRRIRGRDIALFDAGAVVNATDSKEKTALHYAAAAGDTTDCAALLAGEANVFAQFNSNNTVIDPLVLAPPASATATLLKNTQQLLTDLKNLSISSAQSLISAGASVHAVDNNLAQALHYAARASNIDICTALMAKGARVNATDAIDRTVLHYAADIVPGNTLQTDASQAAMCVTLIGNKAPVNDVDAYGKTPLMLAAANGLIATCSTLVTLGQADVKMKDLLGQTALHYAAASGGAGVCTYLLMTQVDVNAQDGLLRTPLHTAVINNNQTTCVALLASKGINVKILDYAGKAPLDYAKRGSAIFAALKTAGA